MLTAYLRLRQFHIRHCGDEIRREHTIEGPRRIA
jgi:hypothetical protein